MIAGVRELARNFRKSRLRRALHKAQLDLLKVTPEVIIIEGSEATANPIEDDEVNFEEYEEILEEGTFELGTEQVRQPPNPEIMELVQTHIRTVRDDRNFTQSIRVKIPDQPTKPLVMVLDQETRWNSKYLMLERFLQLYSALLAVYRDVVEGSNRYGLVPKDLEGFLYPNADHYGMILWIWRILHTGYWITLQGQLEDALYSTILKNMETYKQRLLSLSTFEELPRNLVPVREVGYITP